MVAVEVDKAVDPTKADFVNKTSMLPCHKSLSFGLKCCLHSPSQNVLHSSPKVRDILEFVLMYATIS